MGDPAQRDRFTDEAASPFRGDGSLSLLLAIQAITTFVVVPLSAESSGLALDVARLLFAAVCAIALTRRLVLRAALLVGIVVISAGPALWRALGTSAQLVPLAGREAIAVTAFGFNALVTMLVARNVFGPGRVTAHRILGAVLVHLNVAILFAIAYELLVFAVPDAIRPTVGGALPSKPRLEMAELSYFSLSTITTMAYGDLAPIHPLARSLANLEALFGQLFPPIFIARLVSLQIAFGRGRRREP